MISDGIAVVAESGIFNSQDVQRLSNANIDAILVGEALITSDDIPEKVRELSGVTLSEAKGLYPDEQDASPQSSSA